MTPVELARELGVDPKRLRHWLRERIERGAGKGTRWGELDEMTIAAAKQLFGRRRLDGEARKPGAATATTPRRRDGDQHYVTDLCDEILGEKALREHTFNWLVGDPGKGGRGRPLPIDAYYPKSQLVVEYRERQHIKAMPHFDKPDVMTVSGVHRGEQRKLYDLRRETEIPKHGLRLVIIPCDSLDVNSAGRLRRNRDADLSVIRALLDGP